MKKCPKCIVELKPKNLAKIEVDECRICRGIWFDKDEFRKVKDKTDSDLKWMDFEIWKHEDKFKLKDSALQCPVCQTNTKVIDYGSTSIEINYCPSCKGIWLDKGEFEKIISALENELLNKSFSDYISAAIKEAKEIISGPESFISEWKDFVTVLRLMQDRMFVEKPKLLEKLSKAQQINPIK